MTKEIKKLGLLGELLSDVNRTNFNVFELAHVADMVGGVDKALKVFDWENFYRGNCANLFVFKADEPEVFIKAFEWAACEIIEMVYFWKDKGKQAGAGNLSDDYGKGVNLLKNNMINALEIFENKNEVSYWNLIIESMVNVYAYNTKIEITASCKQYQDKTYLIMEATC